MKLVYKTDNLSRANKILAVLLKAGIKGSIQGKNSYGIREPAFRNVLSVWIHNNNEYINACKALETFYDSEIQNDDKTHQLNQHTRIAVYSGF